MRCFKLPVPSAPIGARKGRVYLVLNDKVRVVTWAFGDDDSRNTG